MPVPHARAAAAPAPPREAAPGRDEPRTWAASASAWIKRDIRRIEDLADAVLGAGLETVQLASHPVSGSLLYAAHRRFVFSSGRINGKVGLKGPLSDADLTLGVGLMLPPGTRHWLTAVHTGSVGAFEPGHEHDSIYEDGSTYLTLTMPAEVLRAEAAREGVALTDDALRRTGVLAKPMAPGDVRRLCALVTALHDGRHPRMAPGTRPEEAALAAFVHYLGDAPELARGVGRGSFEHIVARARAFIDEHLDAPVSMTGIAVAAVTSRRTLNRAFLEVLGETPRAYVLKLRLQRIRNDLASPAEAERTVTTVSHRWGVAELGRLAARYREMFGELPSETLRRRQAASATASDWRDLHSGALPPGA